MDDTETIQSPVPPQSAESADLSRFEYNLLTLTFGFSRWVETCMSACNVNGLGALDILVLHAVNHRARGRRLSEIAMVLNINDSYLIAYALKKLTAAGLVAAKRSGRERHYTATERGDLACRAYREAREVFLVEPFFAEGGDPDVARASALLSRMTSIYEQACRTATAATIDRPRSPPLRTKR